MFREWLARTGDHRVAAERAGVSERTGRRWKTEAEGDAPKAPDVRGAARELLGQPTRFFGRRDVALQKILADGARLVTILGPAGMGKTRLALRHAELRASAYDAVFFCDLSDARTVEEVCAVVGRVLGISGRTDVDAIGYALDARGRVLLILDNFESAVAVAAETAAAWSGMARKAHVVVTSRVQLRVVGEACLFLDPLEMPAADSADPSGAEAVQLFLDRARLVRGELETTPDDVAAIAEIVRRLDGNALAIELAASRLAVLSPKQLLERLAKRFEILVGGARGARDRQASMRVALDGSWELLGDEERDVLADVSVFAAGFTLEAAEHVAGPVLPVIERLRQASLVFARRAGDEVRFGLYETIREYAGEKARELGRERGARDRHLAYFARSAPGWLAGFEGPHAASYRARLALEQSDVVAAMRHAIATGARGPGLAVASLVAAVFAGRARAEVAIDDEVLAAFAPDDEPALEILCARGDAHRRAGDAMSSARDYERALAIARSLGSKRIEALALLGLGSALHAAGRADESLGHYASALALARDRKDDALEARILARIAMTHRQRQETDLALEAAEKARDIFERLGNTRQLADALGTLATLHQRRGELSRARARYEEALPLVDAADPNVAGPFRGNLGTLYNQLGELDDARANFEAAFDIVSRAGIRRLEAVSLGNLASVDFETGRLEEARSRLERVVRMLGQVGDASHEVFFTGQLGAVLATMGHVDEGEALVARAEASPKGGAWTAALSLQRAFVELGRARQLEESGGAKASTEISRLRDSVRSRIASAPAQAVDDVPVAVRMLVRALDRPSARIVKPTMGALTVSHDAGTVWLPTTEKLSLEKRRPVRLLLLHLIEAHRKDKDRVSTVDDLLAAGWPGERVLRDAGAGRVYVALGTLRKLGLRDVIVSRDGGYLLDPKLEVVVLPRLD